MPAPRWTRIAVVVALLCRRHSLRATGGDLPAGDPDLERALGRRGGSDLPTLKVASLIAVAAVCQVAAGLGRLRRRWQVGVFPGGCSLVELLQLSARWDTLTSQLLMLR